MGVLSSPFMWCLPNHLSILGLGFLIISLNRNDESIHLPRLWDKWFNTHKVLETAPGVFRSLKTLACASAHPLSLWLRAAWGDTFHWFSLVLQLQPPPASEVSGKAGWKEMCRLVNLCFRWGIYTFPSLPPPREGAGLSCQASMRSSFDHFLPLSSSSTIPSLGWTLSHHSWLLPHTLPLFPKEDILNHCQEIRKVWCPEKFTPSHIDIKYPQTLLGQGCSKVMWRFSTNWTSPNLIS